MLLHRFPGSTFKMFDLHRFLGFEISGFPRYVTFLLTLFLAESSASNILKPKKEKNINFKAKFSTAFDPFGSALIGALVMSMSTVFMLVFDDMFGLTLLCCIFLARWLLPHLRGRAPPLSVTAVLAPLREALCQCAFHSVNHPCCPHRRLWRLSCSPH